MTDGSRTDCGVLAERLSAALDGDLDPAECRRLQQHASRCPRCGRIVRELRRTTGLCRRAGSAPLPAPVRRKALAHVRALMAGAAPPPRTPGRKRR